MTTPTNLGIAPNARTVYARGCTTLQQLDAPNAEYVDARGCTTLQQLDAPNAEYVDARGCTTLQQLDAPNAVFNVDEGVDLPAITLDKYQERGGPMERLLTAGGATVEQIVRAGAWTCNTWSNCPMHVAFGASSLDDVPEPWRREASRFIVLFDGGFLQRPDHLIAPAA